MMTYADLLYEAADMMSADAAHLERHVPEDGRHPVVDGTIRRLREEAGKIREALRTRSTYPALSTEDVRRLRSRYDDPESMACQDFNALAASHEAIRWERDTAESIADRLKSGWMDAAPKGQWWRPVPNTYDVTYEPMTNDQIAWFTRHNK